MDMRSEDIGYSIAYLEPVISINPRVQMFLFVNFISNYKIIQKVFRLSWIFLYCVGY